MNKPFKMKGHTLPGINQKSPAKDYKKGYYGEGKSPNKWVQFIPMAISAVSALSKMKKDKDKE